MIAKLMNIFRRSAAWLADLPSKVERGDLLTRRILIGLFGFLIFSLFFSGMKIITMKPPAGAFLAGSRSDFDDYFQASRRLRTSGDLYNLDRLRALDEAGADAADPRRFQGVGSYLYPPLTAWVLLPLSYLEYEYAAFIYQTLSVCALGWFFWFVWRRSRGILEDNGIRFMLVSSLAILILYQFLLGNIDNGNIGFFLIAMGAAGLLLGFEQRALVSAGGGFILGIAVVLKITPAFLVLPLVAGGRVAAILGMGLGGLVGLALPAVTLGWDRNLVILEDWYGFLIANFQKYSIVRPWANNQTLSAAVGKLLIAGADMKQGEYGLPLFFRQLPDEATRNSIIATVRGANMFLYLLALLSAVRLYFRGARRPGALLRDAATARILLLAVLVSLVASGVSWYHAYSVLLLPVLCRLLQHFYGGAPLLSGEKISFGVLGIFGLATIFIGPYLREALAMYSVFVFLVLGVTLYTAWLCWFPGDGGGESGSVDPLE